MTRIVTSRYKRPPREKKPQAIVRPAIVTPRSKAAPAVAQRSVKPGNDNHPADPKPRIGQATKPKGRRKAAWTDDSQEIPRDQGVLGSNDVPAMTGRVVPVHRRSYGNDASS